MTSLAETLLKQINDAYAYKPEYSWRISPSSIGKCAAQLWFKFRWMHREPIDGRIARLWQRGHSEEPKIIEILERIGFTVQSNDPSRVDERLTQFRMEELSGHMSGYLDAKLSHPEYGEFIGEFKTYNTQRFVALTKDRLKKTAPDHYDQVVVYLYKFNYKRCLYIAINKNDDSLYIELIERDDARAIELLNKAEAIVNARVVPNKISTNPSFFECKFCPMVTICHLGAAIDRNCRSCKSAFPIEKGQWRCSHWNLDIPQDKLKLGCSDWQGLI